MSNTALNLSQPALTRVLNKARSFFRSARSDSTSQISTQTKSRFDVAVGRIKDSTLYDGRVSTEAPHGYYEGRHIIGANNRIEGGVYIGVAAQEALVIDEKHGNLNDLYHQLIMRFVREDGKRAAFEENIFQQIVKLAQEKLILSTDKVKKLLEQRGIQSDRKTALDFFLREKVGAPRHQILFAGYLLQKLISKQLVAGTVQIDPVYGGLPTEDEKLIYITSGGIKLVFDPTQGS